VAGSEPLRSLAERHGFAAPTLIRHRDRHLAPAVAEAKREHKLVQVEIRETHALARANGSRRSTGKILEELAECFEDVWRVRDIVRQQLDGMESGQTFDPVPLRLLCETIAQARATCQVAVNINHLAIEGERLRMEQEAKSANERDALQALFDATLGEVLAELLRDSLTEAGVAPKVAAAAAEATAGPLLRRIIGRFSPEEG
jgi:hypothetical protein